MQGIKYGLAQFFVTEFNTSCSQKIRLKNLPGFLQSEAFRPFIWPIIVRKKDKIMWICHAFFKNTNNPNTDTVNNPKADSSIMLSRTFFPAQSINRYL